MITNTDVSKIIRKINSLDYRLVVSIEKKFFSRWNDLMFQDRLYYYTDTNTFINGIITKEQVVGKEICLWASRWSHLNDPSENTIGYDLMLKINTPPDVVEMVKAGNNNNHSISLSTQFDDLPMWKMYGDGGNGVMLAFDCKQLVDFYDGRLQYCIYEASQYDQDFIDTLYKMELGKWFDNLDNVIQQYILSKILMRYCSIIKNAKYEYENEVRIIGCGNRSFDEQSKEVYYRYSNGRVIPYVKEYLPKQALNIVVLGPLANVSLSKDSLKEFLVSKGFNSVDVLESGIPYRS